MPRAAGPATSNLACNFIQKTPVGVEPTSSCFAGSRRAVWLQRHASVLARNRTWSSTFAGSRANPAHSEDVGQAFQPDMMLAKRKMSVTELSEKVGITMANISVLKNGKAKAIRFSTLEAICKALDCQPGDILEYEK